MHAHAYTCTFPEGCNCGASEANAMETELTALRAEVSRLRSEANSKDARVISRRIDGGEAWLWQGDGEDHLESLTCPVVIRPAQLRALVEDKARLDWLKEQPYERLQKVREWLPISYVPPAPDNLRAAIDNAMKYDPNYRP